MYVNKKRRNARKKHQKRKLRLQRYRQHESMGAVLKPNPLGWNAKAFFSRPDNEANPFNIPDIFEQVSVIPPYQLLYSEPKEMSELPDAFFGGALPDELSPRKFKKSEKSAKTLSEFVSSPSENSTLADGMDIEGDWDDFMRQELGDEDGNFDPKKLGGLFEEMGGKESVGMPSEDSSQISGKPQSNEKVSQINYDEDYYTSFLDEANDMNDESQSVDQADDSILDENENDDDPYDFDSLFADFEDKLEENPFKDK